MTYSRTILPKDTHGCLFAGSKSCCLCSVGFSNLLPSCCIGVLAAVAYPGDPWHLPEEMRESRWGSVLSLREADILGILMAKSPDASLYEISQHADRARASEGDLANAIIPAATWWHSKRQRLIVGWELARLQLIPVDEIPGATAFPQKLLADLAGNAFNGASFLCVLIAVLSCLPSLSQEARTEEEFDADMIKASSCMVDGI